MKLEVKIDSSCTEPTVIILTDKMTDEVHKIMEKLSDETSQIIAGFYGDKAEIIQPSQIIRTYSQSGKVYVQTADHTYLVRLRLYEMENRLDKTFVRISHSEIINLKKVKGFDLSFSGTICVTLTNGIVTYVSRRYVSKIKQILGI